MQICIWMLWVAAAGYTMAEDWVTQRPDGTLIYRTLPNGDRIMDFSAAGYREGAREFPSPPVVETVQPTGKDDAARIKDAITKVSSRPPDPSSGLRGAIKLAAGHFDVRGASFVINTTGIVIIGSGSNDSGTVLQANMTAKDPPLFMVAGASNSKEQGSRSVITGTVPSGTQVIPVDNHAGFSVGDEVLVCWPQTTPWIQMMVMTKFWSQSENSVHAVERRIVKIDEASKQITVDIPIPFRIDTKYLAGEHQAYITHYTHEGRIREVGLADFRAQNEKVPPYGEGNFLVIEKTEDSWARNVIAVDFGGDTMTVAGKRITLGDVHMVRTIPSHPSGPKPADLALQNPGSQILVINSSSTGDHEFNFITRNGVHGPNVFHNCTGLGTAKAQPHAHFATGLLYDNLNMPQGSIDMIDRSTLDTKLTHGIAIGYGVAWHCRSASLDIISPPDGANWAIGCLVDKIVKPTQFEQAVIDPNGIPSPNLNSLYLAQIGSKLNTSTLMALQNAFTFNSGNNTNSNDNINGNNNKNINKSEPTTSSLKEDNNINGNKDDTINSIHEHGHEHGHEHEHHEQNHEHENDHDHDHEQDHQE